MPTPPRNQRIQFPRPHQTRIRLLDVRDPDERHRGCEFGFEDLDQVFDTFLAVVDGVEEGATEADGCGAEAVRDASV